MSGFANTVFTLMIGWFQTVVSLIWSGLTDKNGGNVFTWIGNHWIVIVLILCAVGIIADLSVYIFRWKPLDVIRSYFDRKKGKSSSRYADSVPVPDDSPSTIRENKPRPVSDGTGYQPLFASNQPSNAIPGPSVPADNPDRQESLSDEPDSWPEVPAYRNENGKYDVPPDSPYRRPPEPVYEPEYATDKASSDRLPDPVVRPRRRRINVSELFGNPEEDMIHFEPPKPAISQSEAYHTPVYPRNWKDNGDSANEPGIRQ